MSREIVKTDKAPKPVGPYSQAVKVNGFLYCSGQVAIVPETGDVLKDADIPTQTKQVMSNIGEVLKEAGVGYDSIFKSLIFLTNMGDFPEVNKVYGEYFPSNPPARSCVAVKELPLGVKVEIEVIAQL